MPLRRSFPLLPAVVLLAVLVVFAGVVGEIGLRVVQLATTPRGPDPRCAGLAAVDGQRDVFRLDPVAGYTMRPGICVRLKSSEFDEVLRTNSRGNVGPEVPETKAPGERRVVILGDSYTAGGQVPYEQSFAALLAAKLEQRGIRNVRVVPAASGGWSTLNEAGYLRANLTWLQPDVVIVASFLGNDVGENVLATVGGYQVDPSSSNGFSFGQAATDLAFQSSQWFPRNPGYEENPNLARWNGRDPLPTPVPNNDRPAPPPRMFWGPLPERVRDPSPSVTARNVVKWGWDVVRGQSLLLAALFGSVNDNAVTTAPGAAAASKTRKPLNITAFEWTILRDRPRAYWLDVAWPLLGQYLGSIKQTAAGAGAKTMLLAIPQIGQFEESRRARIEADYELAPAEVDWERPSRDLKEQADAVGVPLVDLLPLFRARADRASLYLKADEHFTALAHSLTADALAEALAQSGWLAPSGQ